MRGPCVEYLDLSTPPKRCGCPGVGVSLSCPSGRPPAEAGPYCDVHGGQERAQREAEADWDYRAPASVGDDDAVLAAGCASLDSTCTHVVLRQEHGRWLAWLGIGSHMMAVRSHLARPLRRRRGERKADYERRSAPGGCAFDSRELALSEARKAWRKHVDQRVESIRRARGGTLDWGVEVRPADEPSVLDAETMTTIS